MVNPYLVLGGVLYRIVGPPWRLERSSWPNPGWDSVAEVPSSPLVLSADFADFITVNGDVITVKGR